MRPSHQRWPYLPKHKYLVEMQTKVMTVLVCCQSLLKTAEMELSPSWLLFLFWWELPLQHTAFKFNIYFKCCSKDPERKITHIYVIVWVIFLVDWDLFFVLIRHTKQHQCLLYNLKNVELQWTRLSSISLATVKVVDKSNSDRTLKHSIFIVFGLHLDLWESINVWFHKRHTFGMFEIVFRNVFKASGTKLDAFSVT